jgi:hypothetical protein
LPDVAPPTAPPKPSRLYFIGLAPLVLFAILLVVAPDFLQPLFDTRGVDGGIGIGIPILAAILALTVCGIVLMRLWPTALGVALGLLLFTAPSLFLVLIGPAICLIYTNLAAPV